jgi:hypothetical protein
VERTKAYLATVDNDEKGLGYIAVVRRTVSDANRLNARNGDPKRWKVDVHGRLGRNSQHAHLYSRYGGALWRRCAQRIRPEHSARFDIYIRER